MRHPWSDGLSDNFKPFQTDAQNVDFHYYLHEAPELPELPGHAVFRSCDFDVYECGGIFYRLQYNKLEGYSPYAVCSCDTQMGIARICYKSGCADGFMDRKNWLAYSGFEELLLSRDRMILHASLIDSTYGGILFSGPSGVGKSTQAALWQQHEGSTLINGDRPIVGKSENGWLGYGAPYAGSSQCFVNRAVPVRAIVMLAQGQTCRIQRLSAAESFRRLYAQTLVNSWNGDYMAGICDLISELVHSVPVYHLTCTADVRAVDTLKAVLDKGVG